MSNLGHNENMQIKTIPREHFLHINLEQNQKTYSVGKTVEKRQFHVSLGRMQYGIIVIENNLEIASKII